MAHVLAGWFAVLIAAPPLAFPAASQPATRPTQPVDFRDLKELFPPTLAGLRQMTTNGEVSRVSGHDISIAMADYSSDADQADAPYISIEISDFAAMPEFADGHPDWPDEDVQRTKVGGYKGPLKIGEHPAHEWYGDDIGGPKSYRLVVRVRDRFLVKVSGTNINADQIEQIRSDLPLDALNDMN